jgi:hypothetical protein
MRLPGLPIPSGGPTFLNQRYSQKKRQLAGERGFLYRQWVGGIGGGELLDDGDAGLGEGVGDLGFAKAGGVVLEGKGFAGIVHVEAAEAVEIGEFAEALELFVAERSEEFVADFEQSHAGDYSRSGE